MQVQLERIDLLVEITVSDSGPHVFERFRQADSSITRKNGGLGLGLAKTACRP